MTAENSTPNETQPTETPSGDGAVAAPAASAEAAPPKASRLGGMFRKLSKAVAGAAESTPKAEADTETAEDEAPALEGPEDVLKLLQALAENQAMLDDEHQKLLIGDLSEVELFASRKRKAVAYLERLIARVEPLFAELSEELQGELRQKSARFFEQLETNIRLIEANRQAIGHILIETLKIIEKNGGDGIYSQAGQKLLSHQYSATGITAKL